MRINLTSIFVSDEEQALRYYTEVLGFGKKSAHTANVTRWREQQLESK
jgi:catechol 2,3-dioxygenase-like lactoylglutathione lyase family enzyme